MRLVVALFYVAAVVAEHVRIDSLPISARVGLDGLEGSLVDRDRARFEVLFKRGDKKRAQSVALKNTAVCRGYLRVYHANAIPGSLYSNRRNRVPSDRL